MELIEIRDARYEEYEALLLERDQAKKEAGSTWTRYLALFGLAMSRVYEEQLECIRCKKAIGFCQRAMNRGDAVEAEALRDFLKKEMESFQAHLEKLRSDYEQSRDAGRVTEYAFQRAKTLYHRLARLLHPDLNPLTAQEEGLRQLWLRVTEAYRRSDLKALTELEVLARKALKELGAGELQVEIPEIGERIQALKEELLEIRTTEPYTLRELLEDEEACNRKRAALEDELANSRQYRAGLEKTLQDMLDSGRVTLT